MAKIIAIAGASASGKSTLASLLVTSLNQRFGDNSARCLGEDSYYRHRPELNFSQREKLNYDHPESFEHSLLEAHLKGLKAQQAVNIPQYNYSQHQREEFSKEMEHCSFLILEGLHVLGNTQLREHYAFSIFVETPMDICLIRRLTRDVESRGRTASSVLEQYQDFVRPMFYEFVEPSKRHADIVVDGTEKTDKLLKQMLCHSVFGKC